MDEDDRKLIVRLCTRAGIMMEDASALAIGTAGLGIPELSEGVHSLVAIAGDIQKIVSAAEVLVKSPAQL